LFKELVGLFSGGVHELKEEAVKPLINGIRLHSTVFMGEGKGGVRNGRKKPLDK